MIRNHQTLPVIGEMRTFQNISFTRLYSYISLHVHLNNYKSINLLQKQQLISVMITTGKVYFINTFKEVLHNP